jgi:hypothetical protein
VYLDIDIKIKSTPIQRVSLGACEFLRKQVDNNTVVTSCTPVENNAVSSRLARILSVILGGQLWSEEPASWVSSSHLCIDDKVINSLAEDAIERNNVDTAIVVPHMFLSSLLERFYSSLQACGDVSELPLYVVSDYPEWGDIPTGIATCYENERTRVMSFLENASIGYIDARRQLLLENLYSIASYVVPANYLVFIDDDVFLTGGEALRDMIQMLRDGYKLVGYFDEVTRRIHTAFFGMDPQVLRQSLDLFDDGKNLYVDTSQDTGSITFARLNAEDAVAVLGQYHDGYNDWGIHLGHCASEIWCDMPQIVSHHGGLNHDTYNEIAQVLRELAPESLDTPEQTVYHPITDSTRRSAYDNPREYYARLRRNLQWLATGA